MNFLQPSDSTESLSAWSPLKCERDKYAQRYFFSDAPKQQRKLSPPRYVDRIALEEAFSWLEINDQMSDDYKEDQHKNKSLDRVENTCVKQRVKEISKRLKIKKEYKKLIQELNVLKNESVGMLNCAGDLQTEDKRRLFMDSVQNHLKRVVDFKNSKVRYINSQSPKWTSRDRTLALETIKKMSVRHQVLMDEWIETLVNT
ncbi:uncharacterized protein LOC114127358 [Aphis gossypii]|uniref:uncharacterized protein LOC114127358 n=1 Tax=Aphis gossypii TaxID=80765 RepID=UPI002158CCE4|nr:uncharacterized protein LOC114127358 [Aphis gossypii]